MDKLAELVTRFGLRADDLFFERRRPAGPRRQTVPEVMPDPDTLGLAPPNEAGRRYPHGTTTAYGPGRCRCQHCKTAVAAYAHASWLLAGEADLQVVKERLGHASITTTEKYFPNLPGANQVALDALDAIRRPRSSLR